MLAWKIVIEKNLPKTKSGFLKANYIRIPQNYEEFHACDWKINAQLNIDLKTVKYRRRQ